MQLGDKTLCDCGHEAISNGFSTGYGIDANGKKTCFECCGKQDREELLRNGKQIGYLEIKRKTYDGLGTIHFGTGLDTFEDGFYSNWPGTFKIPVKGIDAKRSINNFGAERLDFWFQFEGHRYWGFNVGDNQIAHVRRIKD